MPVEAVCRRCPEHDRWCVPSVCPFYRRCVKWRFAGVFCTLGCVADACADASFLLTRLGIDVCSHPPPLGLFLNLVFRLPAVPSLRRKVGRAWRNESELSPTVQLLDEVVPPENEVSLPPPVVDSRQAAGSGRSVYPGRLDERTSAQRFFGGLKDRLCANASEIRRDQVTTTAAASHPS